MPRVCMMQDCVLSLIEPYSPMPVHNHMTILTFDTDYLNLAAFPSPHAGIIVFRSFPRDTSVSELASAVLKAVAQFAHLDISNRV